MNEIEAWLYHDGPEPEQLRPLLNAFRVAPPPTAEEKERVARQVRERVKAELARRRGVSVATGSTPSTPSTPAQVKGEVQVDEEGATVRSPTLDERTARTAPAEPPVPSLPVEAREARPAQRHPPVDLSITSTAEIPAEFREQFGKLPFRPRAPGMDFARTAKVPEMNWRQGATAPLGADATAKAGAALPFVVKTAGAGAVPFPRLTLEEYASLRAELAVWPARWAAILSRYHVANEAAHRALNEHWGRELAISPEMSDRFQKVFTEFATWLRAQRG